MRQPDIVLVNPNLLKPPVSPVGLEYIAGYLEKRKVALDILDLNLPEETEIEHSIKSYFMNADPVCVGVSIRNIDDSIYPSQRLILKDAKKIIRLIKRQTKAPVILGGVGFSIMPLEVLGYVNGDFGICGDGEESLYQMVMCLKGKKPFHHVPGLVHKQQKKPVRPACMKAPGNITRKAIDPAWYFENGAQVGIETKRGCDGTCAFCADPVAKGRTFRFRRPFDVVREIKLFVDQGINCFHLCDPEFNRPLKHALSVCDAIIKSGISRKLKIYTYCSPLPFSEELAEKMQKSGFAGVDFGIDHLESSLLKNLGRDHLEEDVARVTSWLKKRGIAVMHDLLLGGKGETGETLKRVIDKCRSSRADFIGVSCGVRMYPGTPFFKNLSPDDKKYLSQSGKDILAPLYYVAPYREETVDFLCEIIGNDRKFFYQPLGEKFNYNYADNERLASAIRSGERGAYWHILGKSMK
ncbi:MAG: cobalamin-dependent protein [Candidatus Aureabacteria bacterium]|nr:cobalamin-dependent protein [Candidatus Auribacterota bacterium]